MKHIGGKLLVFGACIPSVGELALKSTRDNPRWELRCEASLTFSHRQFLCSREPGCLAQTAKWNCCGLPASGLKKENAVQRVSKFFRACSGLSEGTTGTSSWRRTETVTVRSAKGPHRPISFWQELTPAQISVELFLAPQAYMDLASICPLAKYTGGDVHYYPQFNINTCFDPWQRGLCNMHSDRQCFMEL